MMWRERLLDLLTALDPGQLNTFAQAFSTLARAAAERSVRLTRDARRQVKAEEHVAGLSEIGRRLFEEIADGAPRELAAAKIAARFGVPIPTVEHYAQAFARSRKGAAMEARRLAAVRLAFKGRSNAEIAKALGVSVRTVERTLKGSNWAKTVVLESHPDSLAGRGEEFRASGVPG